MERLSDHIVKGKIPYEELQSSACPQPLYYHFQFVGVCWQDFEEGNAKDCDHQEEERNNIRISQSMIGVNSQFMGLRCGIESHRVGYFSLTS